MAGSKYCNVQQRYVLSFMGFFAILNAYTMRACLSLAITEMVCNATVCPNGKSMERNGVSIFAWDEELQGLILGSFYIGYVITHVPGALLCEYFGGKYVLSVGILTTAVFSIITPYIVEVGGATGLIILRILMGLGEGTTFPALGALIAAWVPEKERGKLGSFVFGGGQIGTIVSLFFTGLFLHHYTWHSVFYFFGVLALIWFIFFTILCYSSPEEHPFIGDAEKEYLRNEMEHLKRGKELPPTPWKAIFTSLPMLAIITAQVGHDWVRNNGLFSALPFFVMWVCSIASGTLCDYMINNGHISVTNARKLLTAIAAVVPGILIVGASYAGDDLTMVLILFSLAMGFMGLWYPGMKVNPIDLSPNYAATIMAISNGIGALTGAAAPYVVGLLTPHGNLLEWRIVFWITFGVLFITTVAYVLWASGKIQPWNDPIAQAKTIENNKCNERMSAFDEPERGEHPEFDGKAEK